MSRKSPLSFFLAVACLASILCIVYIRQAQEYVEQWYGRSNRIRTQTMGTSSDIDHDQLKSSAEADIDMVLPGAWVPSSKPWPFDFEDDITCLNMERQGKCAEERRPDLWRWVSDIPSLSAFSGNKSDLVRCLNSTKILMVGDSLTRQQHASMYCMMKHLKRKFANFQVTVEFVNAVYLVAGSTGKPGKRSLAFDYTRLAFWKQLTLMNPDYLIFNAGHWIDPYKWKINKFPGRWNQTYHDILWHTFNLLNEYIDNNPNIALTKKHVFFRSTSTRFYREHEWDSGGTCRKFGSGQPNMNASFDEYKPVEISDEPVQPTVQTNSILHQVSQKFDFQVLNVDHLSLMREDATFDCSHWCLPGMPDVWNYIFFNRVCS